MIGVFLMCSGRYCSVHYITRNGHGLSPEALEIAREEVTKRGLNPRFTRALEVQNKTYTIEELDVYCNLINSLNCPICGRDNERLNGTLTAEVMSFIMVSQYKQKVHIGCPDCLDNLNNAALNKTAALGWWAFPSGVIKSIQAISINARSKRTNHQETPNQFLRSFVLSNIGQIEAYKGDEASLRQVIAGKLEYNNPNTM